MRISLAFGSESVGVFRSPAEVVAQAVAAEAAGFSSVWTTHSARGIDSLATIAAAAAATRSIELAVGVVPSFPRHPVALAQTAATLQSLAGGRFTLGVGVSHRQVIEGMYGLDYSDPIGHLREFLTVLLSLLDTGHASHHGRRYDVEAAITVPGSTRVPVVVGALSAGMSRLGGQLGDGVTTWLAGPRSLEQVIVPAVTAGAGEAGKETPRVVAAFPVAVDDDSDRARTAAATAFARYGTLPNYQRLFAREGVDGPADLAVHGDERTVRARIIEYFDAGASDVWAIPFDTGSGTGATIALLKDLVWS